MKALIKETGVDVRTEQSIDEILGIINDRLSRLRNLVAEHGDTQAYTTERERLEDERAELEAYLPLIESPEPPIGELDESIPYYEQAEDTIYQRWRVVTDSPRRIRQRIGEYERLLSDSDYKAYKYAEGWYTEQEYAQIRAQRQLWRDEINRLRGMISGQI